jgi:glycosyltransferase involved in cell wall biosynthesis
MGFAPVLVGEYFPDAGTDPFDRLVLSGPESLAPLDAVVYHHSFHWPVGGQALAGFRGPIAFKYHNVTPPGYFEGFAPHYVERCALGRAQTGELAAAHPMGLWTADSPFNLAELLDAGVEPARACVVPPFTRVDGLLAREPQPRDPHHWLFIGRWAPNKGHRELVECLAMYRRHYAPGARLTVVGAVDESMGGYNVAVWKAVEANALQGAVDFRTHVADDELDRLLDTAGCYVNLSLHEGFCVPVIEAQAVGLPVLTGDAGASAETAGPGQPVVPLPIDDEDFQFVARVAHEIAADGRLREGAVAAGRLNVSRRFTDEAVANAFVGAIEPLIRELSA